MDGMIVNYHRLSTGGRGQTAISGTIRVPTASAVIAEITLSTFDTASASFGTPVTAYGVFTECITNGTNPPLPANETFVQGSLSGPPRKVLIRNGLTSLTYVLEVANASADFIVNVFLWRSVARA
jgi:hypothetical protein